MKLVGVLLIMIVVGFVNAQRSRFSEACFGVNIDIYFLVDVTSGVGAPNVRQVRTYLRNMTEKLRIAPARTRISITTFGNKITNVGSLSDLRFPLRIRNTIFRSIVPQSGQAVSAAAAMDYMSDNLFTTAHGLRTDRRPVCVVVLSSRFTANPQAAASRLQEHCKVVAIGIGDAAVSSNQVHQIASPPTRRNIIVSRRHQDLSRRVETTLRLACQTSIVAPSASSFNIGPTSFEIRWQSQPSIQSYMAEVRAISGSGRIVQQRSNIPSTQLQIVFRNLQEATTYLVNIWARGTDGTESSRARVIVTTSLPTPVIEVDESTITTSSVYISWGRATDLKSNYYITVTEVGNSENSRGHPVSGTNHVITELKSGTRYRVTVATLSGGIRSQESDPAFIVTVSDPPRLQAARVQHIAIFYRWQPVSGAMGYNLVFRDVETDEQRRFDNYTETTLVIRNLTPSKRYELRGTTIGDKGILSVPSRRLLVVTAPSNPDLVEATRKTTTTISFEWGAQPAALGYSVSIMSGRDFRYNVNRNVTNTQFTATGMQPGTFYTITVLSIGLNGFRDANVVYPLQTQTVPSTPNGVKVTRVTSSTIDIQWEASHGVRKYIVFSQAVDGLEVTGNVSQSFNRTETSATAENLQPGTLYDFMVIAEGIQGQQSAPSPSIRDSTYAAVPNQPTATFVNGSFISLDLEPAEGATSYILEIDTLSPADRRFTSFTRVRELTDLTGVSTDRLARGVWYTFVVKSKNVFGKTNPQGSEPLIEQTVPSPPNDAIVTRAEPTSLTLRWLPATGAVSYIVYLRSTDFDEEFTKLFHKEYPTEDTEYTAINLRTGTNYQYFVQTVGHAGRKSSLGIPKFRQTIPGVPQNVRKTAVTVSTVTLEWDATKGAASYHVVAGSLFSKEIYGYNSSSVPRLTVSELNPGTWYNFSVHARDPRRQRNDMGSSAINVQTVPLAPPNVRARRPTVHSFRIAWDDTFGAAAYRVRAFTTDDDVTTKESFVRVNGTTQAQVDELDSGTRYRFFVSSIGFQEQRSHETERISDVTLPATPDKPVLDRVTTRSLAMSWNEVKGAVEFAVKVFQALPFNETTWELLTDTNSIVVRQLIPGAFYNVSIYSIGIRDRRNNRDSVPLTEQTVPLAPITVEFNSITSTNVSLQWNSVIGAGAYMVIVRNLDDLDMISETETIGQAAVIRNLLPGTRYTFRIISIGEDNRRRSVRSSPAREETNPDTPDPVTISNVRSSSLMLDWNAVKGARQYVVRIFGPAQLEPQEISVPENNFLVPDLMSGTLYHFTVFSVGVRDRRNPKGSDVRSAYTAPAPPTDIETSSVETNSLILDWSDVQGAVSYTVTVTRYGREFRGEEGRTILTSESRLLVDGLEPGTEYVFDIRAIGNEDRTSEAHTEFRDATLPEVPSTPTVGQVTTNTISISWDDASGAVRYQIFVGVENGETTEFSSLESNFVLRQLDSGTRYSFRLRSVGPRGRQSDSLSDTVTQQTVTNPPQGFDPTSASIDSIGLSWQAAVGASSYSLVVSSEEGDRTMTFDMTSAIITELRSGIRYTFTLRSIGDDNVESTDTSEAVETTLPATPTSIQVDDVTPNTIVLSWPSVTGAVSYRIEIESPDHSIGSPLSTNQPNIRLDGLNPGIYYNIIIFSIGIRSRINEEGSDLLTLQTDPTPPIFQVTSVSISSIAISWDEVTGASGYRFTFVASDDSGEVMSSETDETNIIFDLLIPGVEYVISGWTIGQQEGRESFSYSLTDSTLPNAPDQPQGGIVTSTTIEISWERKLGAIAYLVTVNDNPEPIRTDNNRITQTNLDPGSFYRFQVHSVGAKNRRNPVGSPVLQVQTAPAPVNNFAVVEETTNTISLSWEDVVGRARFEITVTTSADPEFLDLVSTEDTSITITGLSPGVAYFFQLQPIGMQRQRTSDESVTFGTTYPNVPQSLTEISTTTTTVTIEWMPSQGALSYEVVVESNVPESPTSITTEETSRRISDLIPGGVYTFKIFAIGTGDRKNPESSEELIIQTVPLPPTNFQVIDSTVSDVSLSWNDVFGRSSFSIIVIVASSEEIVREISTEEVSYTISGLSSGILYEFRIQTIAMQTQRISEFTFLQHRTLPGTPNQPSVVSTTTTSISLEWDEVIGASSYAVMVRRQDVTTDDVIIDVTVASVIVDGLVPGANYEFIVYSIGDNNRRNNRGSPSIVKQTITLPPSGVQVGDTTPTSIPLSWDDVYGAPLYKVVVYEINDETPTLVDLPPVELPFHTITALEQGKEYRITVRSIGVDGDESADSLEVVTATLPDVVESITVVDVGSDGIEIEWSEAQGSNSYVVVVTNVDDNSESTLTTVSLSIVAADLRPGRFYRFNIISTGSLFFTNIDSEVSATAQTIPLSPSFIEINDIGTTSFSVTWDDVYGAASYVVIVASSVAEEDTTQNLPSAATSLTVSNLLQGTGYDVIVVSIGRESQRSAESDIISETTLPETPSGLRFGDVTTTSARLQWDEVKGALNYQVYYSVRDSTAEPEVIETASTELVLEGLESGLWYEFVVFSIGIRNRRNDKESDALHFQTVPLPPETLDISDVTTTSLVVIWDAAVGAASYRLSYSSDADEEPMVITTSSTIQQVIGLQTGTRYTFYVVSVGDVEQISDVSDEISDTTVPATPNEVKVSNIQTTSVDLSWQGQRGATSYRISVRNLVNNETVIETSTLPNAVITELLPGIFHEFIVFSVGTEMRVNLEGSEPASAQTVPSTPSNIVTAGSDTSSLSVSWQAVVGAASYFVWLTSSDSTAIIPPAITTSETSTVFSGLSSGTSYSFQVVAIGEEGQRSGTGRAESRTVLPGQPDQPTVVDIATDHITIEWAAVKGAVGYQVIVTSDVDENSQEIEVVEPSVEVTSLLAGNRYRFVVFSISVDGKSNPEGSEPLVQQTVTLPPSSVEVGDVTTTSIPLTWDSAFGAMSYNVIVNEVSNGITTLVESTLVEGTFYTATSLVPGREYSLKVRSVGDDSVESEDSIEILTATLPNAVSNITIIEVATEAINIEWLQAEGARRYVIITTNIDDSTETRLETDATTIRATNLRPGRFYRFNVISVGSLLFTNTDDTVTVRSQTIPLATQFSEISEVTTSSFHVTWDPSYGSESYIVNVVPSVLNEDVERNIPSTDTSLIVNGLRNGTQYTVTIVSIGQESQRSAISDAILETTLPGTTSRLRSGDISTTSIEIYWNEVKGAIFYQVQYRIRASTDDYDVMETAAPNVVIEDLEAGLWYEIVVFSVGIGERRNDDGSEPLHLQTEPSPPTNIMTSDADSTSLLVSWQAVIGAASYIVTVTSPDRDAQVPPARETSATIAVFRGLTSGTTYLFQVEALGEGGLRSSPGQAASRTVLPGVPGQPEATEVTTTSITIQWTPVKGAVGYRVIVMGDDNKESQEVRSVPPTVEVTSLSPGLRYNITVFSISENGDTNPEGSAPLLKQTVTDAPTDLVITDVQESVLEITWEMVTGAESYIVTISSEDEDALFPSPVMTEEVSTVLQNLNSGTLYSVSVVAVNFENQRSEESISISTTTLPATPNTPQVTDVQTNSISLTWPPVKGAAMYLLVITNEDDADIEDAQEVESETSSAEVAFLSPGTRYRIRVFSSLENGASNSEGSEALVKQTIAAPPAAITISDVQMTMFVVSWQSVTGAQSYVITVTSSDPDAQTPSPITTQLLSLSIDSLSSGTLYEVTIVTINFESERSASSSLRSIITLPVAPESPQVTDVQTNSISLTWNSVKGADSYQVSLMNTDTDETQLVAVESTEATFVSLEAGTFYEAVVFAVSVSGVNVEGESTRVQTVPLPPSNVQIALISTEMTSLTISWQSVKGARLFQVLLTSTDDDVFTPPLIETTGTAVVVPNLSYGTLYTTIVSTVGQQGQRSDFSEGVQQITPPDSVDDVVVISASSSSISLMWTPAKGAVSYIIRVKNTDNNDTIEITTTLPIAMVSSLESGTTYEIVVLSVGVIGINNRESEVVRKQTVPLPPSNIVFLTESVTTNSITISWNPVKGALSYDVIYGEVGDLLESTRNTASTTVEVNDLLPGKAYGFRLVAIGEEEQRSEGSDVAVSATKPFSVTTIEVIEVSTTMASLRWGDYEGAQLYRVIVYNENDDMTTSLETAEGFASVSGLRPGTNYQFSVVSIGALNVTNVNNEVNAAAQTVPNPPRVFEATDVSTETIELLWSASRGATSYLVTTTWIELLEERTREITSETTSVTVDELFPGTQYRFTVRSVSMGGVTSEPSHVVEETTRPDVATNLVILDITTTSTTLQWEVVKGARGYNVYYRIRHSTEEYSVLETDTTEATVTGLESGLWYELVVFSVGIRGRINEDGSDVLHLQTAPLPPSAVTISDVGTTSLAISWNNVTGAQSYSIRAVYSDGDRTDLVFTTEENNFLVRGLETGTSYDFYVTAIGEESLPSDESDVTSETTIPGTAENLRVDSKTTTSATISWDVVKGAITYIVSIESVHLPETLILRSTINTVTLRDLVPGGWYDARVETVGVEGRVNPVRSEELQVQTVPLPPQTVSSSSVTTSQVVLEWNEVLGAHSYVVRISSVDEEDNLITSESNSLTVGNLEAGTEYNFYVTSVGEQEQESVESNVVTETTIPNTPENLRVVSQTTTRANLTWNAVKGAVRYVINGRSSNTDQTFVLRRSTNFISIPDLIPGGWYIVSISSVGAGSQINPVASEEVQFQTVPLPPNDVNVTSVTTSSINLQWTSALGASSYEVRYFDENNQIEQIATSEVSTLISSLPPGKFYTFTVISLGEQRDLVSSESNPIRELTRISSPATIRFDDVTTNSVQLGWQAVEGASEYFVSIASVQGESYFRSATNAYTVINLNPGTIYTFKVASLDAKDRESETASEEIEVITVTLPPSNLRVTTIRPRSFTVVWDSPQGANMYEVTVFDRETLITNSTTENNQVVIEGLRSGILYSVAIAAINSNGKRSDLAVLVQRTVPPAPPSISVIITRPTHLNLTWEEVNGATSYEVVYQQLDQSTLSPESIIFNSNVGAIENLLPGTQYRITVFSIIQDDIRSDSNTTIVQRTRLIPPKNLVANSNNETSVELDWDDVKGAEYYSVYITGSNGDPKKAVAELETERKIDRLTESEVLVTNLQPRVNYTFEVTSSVEDLESDRSASVSLQTYASSPQLPRTMVSIITISRISISSFTARWPRIENAVSYIVVVRTLSTAREIPISGARNTQTVITGLEPDTTYNVTLKAVGVIGDQTEESFPPAVITTRPLPPSRPNGVAVSKVRASYLEVEWEPSRRAISYIVTILEEDSGRRRQLTNVPVTRANITGLTVLNNYVIQVIAVGVFERSTPSTAIRAQARHPVPEMPRGAGRSLISIRNITFNSMIVEVEPVAHADSYIIILRRRNFPVRRLRDVRALTPVPVEDLAQNAIYDVTYRGIGRGGELSEESNVVTTRTLRLIPGQPVDFQVAEITSSYVTVQWSDAMFATGYRVSAQNTRTGVTRVYDNATSPYRITGLEFRETYSISAASVGEFFESEYVTPITINIPYPGAEAVAGINADLITSNGFRVQWLPTPFAVSYTVLVAEGSRIIQRIVGVGSISRRVSRLKQNTIYNVTVLAVSHDGLSVASGNWIRVRTGRRVFIFGQPVVPAVQTDEEILETIIERFVYLLLETPQSEFLNARPSGRRPDEDTNELTIDQVLEQTIQQMKTRIENILRSREAPPPDILVKNSLLQSADYGETAAFETLFSLAGEIKNLVRSDDATEAIADSIATRLTQALAVLTTSSATTLEREISREEVNELLFPIIHHQINDLLISGGLPVVIDDGSSGVREQSLRIIVDNRTIRATGFSLAWAGYQNTHRYQVVVERLDADNFATEIINGIRPGRSIILSDLSPSTTYNVIVRPVDSEDQVISGVVGRAQVRTSDPADENFEVEIETLSYNIVTLSWQRFPAGVRDLLFTIMRVGEIRPHQQFSISYTHTRVTFTSLLPGTMYNIAATSLGLRTLYSTTIQTLSGTPPPVIREPPISNTLVPPSGLRLVSSTRQSMTIEWFPVRIRGRAADLLRYSIRVFGSNSQSLRRFVRFQVNTRVTISRLSTRAFDVTVTTYNILTRRESAQSPRLRVDLRRPTRN